MKTYTIQEFDNVNGWKRKKKVNKKEYDKYILNKGYCPECRNKLTKNIEEKRTILSCNNCGIGYTN